VSNGINVNHLKSFVERIERLDAEKDAIGEDIKEVYQEAKSSGFDPKVMRKVIRLRKQAESARKEAAEILSLYCDALDMQGVLPL
jgi:uncharacterized protein (UPF0335 family)